LVNISLHIMKPICLFDSRCALTRVCKTAIFGRLASKALLLKELVCVQPKLYCGKQSNFFLELISCSSRYALDNLVERP
jgi:hypothetical protein